MPLPAEEAPAFGWVATGGVVGATLRWGATRLQPTAVGTWPWTTLAVNVGGSFVLGLLAGRWLRDGEPSRSTRAFVASGVLGAFTTFSALAVETDLLVHDGHGRLGLMYAAVCIVAGVVAAAVGLASSSRAAVP